MSTEKTASYQTQQKIIHETFRLLNNKSLACDCMIRRRLKLDINIVCLGYFLHEKDIHHENSKKYKGYIEPRPETLKRIPNLKQLTAVLDRLLWGQLGTKNELLC